MSGDSKADSIEARWWADRRDHLEAGLGFLSYRTPEPPLHGRVPDFQIVRIGDELPKTGYRNSALILPHLTVERLTDHSFVKLAGATVAEATSRRIAVIAATPLGESAFAATSGTSDAEPWELDIDAMVGGTDLVFVLESTCLARATGEDATYLTPIEARLAQALREKQIPHRRQHFIGYHCVDFLVGERLVVECDGIQYHDADSDRTRDAALEARGYSVLRLPGRLIHHDTLAAVARVLDCLSGDRVASFRPSPDLTDQQKAAVLHRNGPARVAAPAGSGKTFVIEERVKGLIALGIEPSRICAVSFTKKAVEEMQTRLSSPDAIETRFTTIHGLAKSISEGGPHGRERRLIQGVRSSRSPTRWTVLAPLLADSERFWGDRVVWGDALNAYRQNFAIPDLSKFPVEQRPTPDRLVEVHHAFDAELARRGLTDFEGYVLNALRALARSADYRRHCAAMYDYWIVDEYQDLPTAKLDLLRLLVSPQDNLFVVGDDDQIIYGFAGASASSFADFSSLFQRPSEYVLDTNFRCDHEIVVRSSWLIARNNERVAKDIRPDKPLGERTAVTIGDPATYDADALRFVRSEFDRGVLPHQIALLFRLKEFAAPVELQLERAGIPYIPCAFASFFDTKVVSAVRAWLRLVSGTASPKDVRKNLIWPTRYLRAEHLDLVSRSLPDGSISVVEASTIVLQVARGVDEAQKRDALEKWAEFAGRAADLVAPASILDALALRSVVEQLDGSGDTPASVSFDVFARLASEFETVAGLERWIATRGMDRDYTFDSSAPPSAARAQTGRVLLTSIHQVKGQEFVSVAVLGPPDGMPDRRATTPEQLEEERRIAYVAVTRAESSLLFAASPRYAQELSVSPQGETWHAYRARVLHSS